MTEELAKWYGQGVTVIEDGPYPLGKYSTLHDEYLHQMCMEGWANESFGDVASPVGYVYRVSNSHAEIPEIFGAFGPIVRGIVGHFLVIEDDQGFVSVEEYGTEAELLREYGERENAFAEWDDEGDE